MSQASRTRGMPEGPGNDACLDLPFDFITFLSRGRQLEQETAELLLCEWLERYEPLKRRSIAVLVAGTCAHPMHPWMTAEERSAWRDLHRAHCGCDDVPATLAEMCRSASRSRMAT